MRFINPTAAGRLAALLLLTACAAPRAYDVVLRGGTIYDGSGGAPVVGDVALRGDSIVATGIVEGKGTQEIDATGLAVAPGFINMLSWATESLIEDGRSQSDIRQGVTLEVMGEGDSMGPLSDTLRADMLSQQGDITFPITWRTLRGYQDSLVKKGISTNIASFIGATTVRINHVGWDDRAPTATELEAMQAEVRTAMEEGALEPMDLPLPASSLASPSSSHPESRVISIGIGDHDRSMIDGDDESDTIVRDNFGKIGEPCLTFFNRKHGIHPQQRIHHQMP